MDRDKKRRAALAVISGTVLVSVLTGCANSGGTTSVNKGTIGFITLNQTQEIFISQTKAAQQWADKNSYKLLVGDPNNDPLTQANIIDGWIDSKQVDALLIGPVDEKALLPSLDKANTAKIPTIVSSGLDKPQNDHQGVLVVDWNLFGRNAGEALAGCINERFGGTAKIVILDGPELPGDIVTGRINGELQKIKELSPKSTVVAQQNGQGKRLPSLDIMAALLLANPDITAVTGTNDDSMIGVANAFKAAGKDPSKMCIVGLDATEEGLALVKSGEFYATVDLQPIQQILDGLKLLNDMKAGSVAADARRIVVDTKIVKATS
ncbi:MAG: hypothetical protein B5766_02330 [Candidatus Lumbricidophila eiseniae]|uniref:Periplasmic binding protein domain-containing protein n=1 Tax=Candidatus Lumbricidiphila eiseniae TaxID=1969409 RepID=A0A2A6FU98_9MICO|nr:MAG: hypothetical protein B5766_02330 [Candidatus Lumbricidophila eiseniae]